MCFVTKAKMSKKLITIVMSFEINFSSVKLKYYKLNCLNKKFFNITLP